MDYISTTIQKIEESLDLKNAKLGNEYFYQSLPLCVIDAVFSLNLRYTVVQNVIEKYCRYYDLKKNRTSREVIPEEKDQESIHDFVSKYDDEGSTKFTQEIFNNRNLTSPQSGILKSEASYKFAKVLDKHGIQYFQDLPRLYDSINAIEKEIRSIPGQTKGTSFTYFLMLAGDDNLIKPDRMIIRFLNDVRGKTDVTNSKENETYAKETLEVATKQLQKTYPFLTQRLLDHAIWLYQSKSKN